MVWDYPEISKEDFTKLLKGFVDMLILGSGFQSSGLPAHWDAENCRKALQWGLFFENAIRSITSSDASVESVIELEEAIYDIKSNPLFPKGLENLSSSSLSKGREFVLEHLMNNSTLNDKQLRAILVAAVESCDDITSIINEKLSKRQSNVSCVSALEAGLNILTKNIETKESLQKQDKDTTLLRRQEPIELLTWNVWQSKSLSYFLSKRTLRLVSGANLIFSAPKAQWVEVLRRLRITAENDDDDIFIEKIELLLIGCLTSRWTHVIEGIMSVSYKSVTVSEQYEELCKLLLQRSKTLKDTALDSKVEEIIEYLSELLESRFHRLWKLPSSLAAAAIPSWSPLFGLYIGEIEKQLKLDFSTTTTTTTRCCSCYKDLKEHKDCELAERVWCLYVFNILQDGSRETNGH